MPLLITRLFLFVLLVGDWAGDPYFGQSPLSRPMSSQQAYCHSLVHQQQLSRACSPARQANPILNTPSYDLPCSSFVPSLPEAPPATYPAVDLIFVFMSILR
jgi:hypothetical protein